MGYALPRFLVTLACAPLLLCLGMSPVHAQESNDIFTLDGLTESGGLATTLTFRGQQQQTAPTLDLDILPLDARKLLMQLDETKPEMADSPLTRSCLERLQKLQSNYTKAGYLDEASMLRDSIEEFLARRAGIEPDPGNLTSYRDKVGKTYIFRVTGHKQNGSIWGSQPYTDDTTLSIAAVHSGLLRDGQRGTIKVTILPGQDHYDGGEANGINSSSYETWQGSYSVAPGTAFIGSHEGKMPEEAQKLVEELTKPEEKADAERIWKALDQLQTLQDKAQQADKLDEALAIREGIRALIIKLVDAHPAPASMQLLRGKIGKSFYFVVTGKANGSIWGSEVYTDDSDLATVAVHAGILRPGQKGIVQVTVRMGLEGYGGAESHGVVSGDYGPWKGSYRVSAFRMPPRPNLK